MMIISVRNLRAQVVNVSSEKTDISAYADKAYLWLGTECVGLLFLQKNL
jgi:hypothetical protein